MTKFVAFAALVSRSLTACAPLDPAEGESVEALSPPADAGFGPEGGACTPCLIVTRDSRVIGRHAPGDARCAYWSPSACR